MTTVITPLDEEGREWVRGISPTYLHGMCYEFAAALSRITGWPMIALDTTGAPHGHRAFHVGVWNPAGKNGHLWDIRGEIPERVFAAKFGAYPPLRLHDITLEELRHIRPVKEANIEFVAGVIEVIWPDLPFLPVARREKIRRFTDKLEALSRAYGFWLHGQGGTAHLWPRISHQEDNDVQYEAWFDTFGRIRMERTFGNHIEPNIVLVRKATGPVTDFMAELNELSTRTGLWIRSPIPAPLHWPILLEAEGDEQGYELKATLDTIGYLISTLPR